MKKLFLALAIVGSLLVSCSENNTETLNEKNKIVTGTIDDDKGTRLEYSFDHTKNTATFRLNGKVIEMALDTTMASGSHYKNDRYTYSDWHGNTELKEDGVVIFFKGKKTADDIVESSVTDEKGKTLYMLFDNARGTARFILDKDTIETRQDTVASGIRCSNKDYVFTEHHGAIELKKGTRILFSK
jgi:membrane-bound inhibitor of C-type lysozyme